MQNSKSGDRKSFKPQIIVQEDLSFKSKNVDINRLLNRIKENNIEEKKKKITLLILAILPILVTGLIVF